MFRVFSLLCFLYLATDLPAQEGIETSNTLSAEELVKDVFIKGSCRNVSNINAIGDESMSIGQFKNAKNSINISDGIILSTGDIDLADGPNITIDATFAFDVESDDPDLSALATSTLFDVTGLEFDFVPLDETVTFRYVFASEEYCEFVGTSFNDVFGFFVSGPGINGPFNNNAINVAKVISLAGTEVSVSINNINHLSNETFYVSNITTSDAQNCDIEFVQRFQELIEYDGFTIALTASFQVIPCETYHIRLVIGDVGDPNLDSVVFLETNSFDLGEGVTIRAEVPGNDEPVAYEGCIDGQFVFTRNTASNINEDLVVNYSISPESTATNGIDFEAIPLSITIPAGERSFILPITIIEDNITEGPESIKLALFYDCDCIDPTLSELLIDEADTNLSAGFEPILVCAGQEFSLSPEVSGGVPPLSYLWNTGIDTSVLQSTIISPTQYSVTITDLCGNSSLALADVEIQDIPIASITGSYDLCDIADTGIPIELQGNAPWQISYSINGIDQAPIDSIFTSPYILNAPGDGVYLLTAFSDAYCEGEIMGSAVVESNFTLTTAITPPSCQNSTNGSIEITQLEAVDPFSLSWNIDTQDNYMLINLSEGRYVLSIVDGDNCEYERVFDLMASSESFMDCVPVYIPNVFSPNNDGVNDVFSIFFDPNSGVLNVLSMQVYSRWGNLIYQQSNFIPDNGQTGWGGDFKGNPLTADVFLYKVVVGYEDGSTQLLQGEVSLVR